MPFESFLDPDVKYRCGVCDKPIQGDECGGVRQALYSKQGGLSGIVVYLTCRTHTEQEIKDAYFECEGEKL